MSNNLKDCDVHVAIIYFRCSGCEAVLQGIETQITKANQNKDNNMRQKQKMEQEVRTRFQGQ